MIPYRLYFVGIQLLLLLHVANSLILLTANMEDVKKIARKFVSDSLADKIAEFVAKATHQLVANVSEENDENVNDIQNLSDEDQLQNIGRQRLKKRTKNTKNYVKDHIKYVEIQKEYKKEDNVPKVNKEIPNAGQVINWEKEVNEIVYDMKNSKEAQDKSKKIVQPVADNKQQKNDFKFKPDHEHSAENKDKRTHEYKQPIRDYEHRNLEKTKQNSDYKKTNLYSKWQKIEYEQQDPEQKRPNHEDHKLVYEKPKTARKPKSHAQNEKTVVRQYRRPSILPDLGQEKPRSTNRPTTDYTILNHKSLRNGSPTAQRTYQRGHRLTGFDSQEYFNQTSRPALRGFNIPKSLTTEKERVDFDQYDNPNYPKSEFIATSGPVALPKVPMMKPWWEKEMVVTR